MSSKYRRLVARGRLAAIPVVAAAAVAGGVIGVSSASANSSGHAASAISKSTLAKVKAEVTAAQQAPKWYRPGPKVNAKKALKNKTIVTFPISSEIDACNTKGQQGYLDAEASKLGAKVIPLQSNSGPPGWQADLSQAITDKASAVVMLCGPSAAAIAPQLATLKSDHIPVVDGNYNQIGGNPAFPFTNLSAESGVNTIKGVQTDLADALVNLKGKPAKILFLDSTQVAQDSGAYGGLKSAIKTWCPSSCSIVKTEYFGTQVWSSPTETSEISSDLQANPSINTVIVTFDGMTDGIESTVQAAAATHAGLKMYAWGGGLAEIKDVQVSSTFVGDSGPDEKWDAYNQLDQTIRLLAHKAAAPLAKEVAPNLFFTKSNAKIFSVGGNGTAYSDKAFSGGAFVKDFLKLWEVTK
ncbi:MAG TPA: substrate-binding domain-containing protein [Solirubrobacteraceae bacterium]|nr:substrate-binding domain-containing protein [Solirubrobacteraceae bacterium]